MHVLAFLLPLFIFLHFSLLGKATMVAIKFPGSSLRSWLISPTLGFSLQILIVSIINQAGWPVEQFAKWEAIITSTVAIIILARKRPLCNLRLLTPFIISSLIVLFYAGWPLLKLGCGWVSYCNDDMANYCLAAMRHLHHDFFEVPTLKDLLGSDYSQYYWFMHVGSFTRYGSELLLSWVAGVTGLNPLTVFMPTIIALAMAVPLATATLARAGEAKYKAMVVSAALLSFSPLFLLGIFYQLIAQLAGLAILCISSALFMSSRMPKSWQSLLRLSIIGGTIGATFSITYPELSPFFALGFLLWIFVRVCQSRSFFWKSILFSVFSGAVALVWLRYNVIVYLVTILAQSRSGTQSLETDILFPYFLVPSGIPALFGLLPIAGSFGKIEGYITMAAATVLLLFFIILVIRSIKKGKSHAYVTAVMLLMGGWLFYKQIGFGTFKLAMFIQPFIAIELALFLCGVGLMQLLVGVGIYFFLQFPAGLFYGTASLGDPHAKFVEVPEVSKMNLAIKDIKNETIFSLASAHVVVEKFAACITNGHQLFMDRKDSFGDFHAGFPPFIWRLIGLTHPHSAEIFSISNLSKERELMFEEKELLGTSIKCLRYHPDKEVRMLRVPRATEIFNGLITNIENKENFFQQNKLKEDEPFLSFVNSQRGEHYYGSLKRKAISFYQNQDDLYSPVQSLSGIGSYFLFQVDDPSLQDIYLRIAVTKSILGKGRTALYEHAIIKGSKDKQAGFQGNGAANIYVGPIRPLSLDGTNYIAIDFGEEGQLQTKNTSGIMGLYRVMQPIDPRYITGYARDISAVTVDKYRAMERPREIVNFPKDIAEAKTLEFSGWYEDGFISQNSYIVLAPKQEGDCLLIKGVVPGFGKLITEEQKMTVVINGKKSYEQKMKLGAFEVNIPITTEKNKDVPTRVDITFSSAEYLPEPDFRPISAKINYLGLKNMHSN